MKYNGPKKFRCNKITRTYLPGPAGPAGAAAEDDGALQTRVQENVGQISKLLYCNTPHNTRPDPWFTTNVADQTTKTLHGSHYTLTFQTQKSWLPC